MVPLTPYQRDMLLYISNPGRFRTLSPWLCSQSLAERNAAIDYLRVHNLIEICPFSFEFVYKATRTGWTYVDNLSKEQLLLEDTRGSNE